MFDASKTTAAAIENGTQPVQKPQKIVAKPMNNGGNRKEAPQKQKASYYNQVAARRKNCHFGCRRRYCDLPSSLLRYIDISRLRQKTAAAKNFFSKISATYKKSQDIVYFSVDNHNHLCNIAGLFVFYNF